MSSSLPVKETGWNDTVLTLSIFRIANWRISPTWSLLTPLMIVVTSVSVDAVLVGFSIARSLTS